MSPCPVCSQPVDPLRSRAVAVRDGKVISYCSKECLAKLSTNIPRPMLEIASTAPAKRDDTIGTWAIGDDTAIRKYGERTTAEHEALAPAHKSRAGIVIVLLILLGAGAFGVYHYMHGHDDASAANRAPAP